MTSPVYRVTKLTPKFNPGVERSLIYGSGADRYHGTPGPPPNDVDVLLVGSLDRAGVNAAADRARACLGMQVNPVIGTLNSGVGDGSTHEKHCHTNAIS